MECCKDKACEGVSLTMQQQVAHNPDPLALLLQEKHLVKDTPVERVTFTEITKKAVIAALGSPRAIDKSMVEAYLARRALDRLFGYTLSPCSGASCPALAQQVSPSSLQVMNDGRDNVRLASHEQSPASFCSLNRRIKKTKKPAHAVLPWDCYPDAPSPGHSEHSSRSSAGS